MEMSSSDSRHVLVLGGAGEVGEGIVRVFLREGWKVIVPSREESRLLALRQRLGEDLAQGLVAVTSDISDLEQAQRLRDEIQHSYGPLDAVVTSVAKWWQGTRIIETSPEDWQKVFRNNLNSHFFAVTTFYPLLKPTTESCYLFVTGSVSQEPTPNSGLISIFGIGQVMMKDVIHAEAKPAEPRVNTLMINTPVQSRSRQYPNKEFLTSDEIGQVAEYVCSPRGMQYRGETIQLSTHSDIHEIVAAIAK